MTPRQSPAFMNGVPELLILRLLEGGEMYGYQIIRAIREATGETISLGEGVVYPALHALESSGRLTSTTRRVDGRARVYYRLTPEGRRRLARLTGDWSRVAGAVRRVLQQESAQ